MIFIYVLVVILILAATAISHHNNPNQEEKQEIAIWATGIAFFWPILITLWLVSFIIFFMWDLYMDSREN